MKIVFSAQCPEKLIPPKKTPLLFPTWLLSLIVYLMSRTPRARVNKLTCWMSCTEIAQTLCGISMCNWKRSKRRKNLMWRYRQHQRRERNNWRFSINFRQKTPISHRNFPYEFSVLPQSFRKLKCANATDSWIVRFLACLHAENTEQMWRYSKRRRRASEKCDGFSSVRSKSNSVPTGFGVKTDLHWRKRAKPKVRQMHRLTDASFLARLPVKPL